MIKSFANDMTSDVFHGVNSKAARRLPQRVWTAAKRRLDLLNAAGATLDLSAMGGLVFKPLKWHKPGFFSIRVNDQYRIIFRFEHGDAYDVSIEDFHGE